MKNRKNAPSLDYLLPHQDGADSTTPADPASARRTPTHKELQLIVAEAEAIASKSSRNGNLLSPSFKLSRSSGQLAGSPLSGVRMAGDWDDDTPASSPRAKRYSDPAEANRVLLETALKESRREAEALREEVARLNAENERLKRRK